MSDCGLHKSERICRICRIYIFSTRTRAWLARLMIATANGAAHMAIYEENCHNFEMTPFVYFWIDWLTWLWRNRRFRSACALLRECRDEYYRAQVRFPISLPLGLMLLDLDDSCVFRWVGPCHAPPRRHSQQGGRGRRPQLRLETVLVNGTSARRQQH